MGARSATTTTQTAEKKRDCIGGRFSWWRGRCWRGNKGHCGSISWPQVELCVGDLTCDGRLSPPPCVTQIAEAGEGRAAWCLRAAAAAAATFPPRPYKPNTRRPFWCLSRRLHCTCAISTWRRFGFVRALCEAARQGHISRSVSR